MTLNVNAEEKLRYLMLLDQIASRAETTLFVAFDTRFSVEQWLTFVIQDVTSIGFSFLTQ